MDWNTIPSAVRNAARDAAALLAHGSLEELKGLGHFPKSDMKELANTVDPFRPFTGLAPADEEAFSEALAVERPGRWELEVPIFADRRQTDLYLYLEVDSETLRTTMTDIVVP